MSNDQSKMKIQLASDFFRDGIDVKLFPHLVTYSPNYSAAMQIPPSASTHFCLACPLEAVRMPIDHALDQRALIEERNPLLVERIVC